MKKMSLPLSTYRLQLHRDFTFRDAIRITPYLSSLGITHVYVSPLLSPVPGSMHGYDTCDYGTINPELGGDRQWNAWLRVLRRYAMGLIMDFVPNHMGADPVNNPWWRDVLERGRASRYAHFFDIHWNESDPELQGKVLLPILGDTLERELARGAISLGKYDGKPFLEYHEHRIPIRWPKSGRDFDLGLRSGLARKAAWPEKARALRALLDRQAFLLTHWEDASTRINYRRFFNITSLAAVRVEDPEVFSRVHQLVSKLLRHGKIQGLRLDHIDGLKDPQTYLDRLHKMLSGLRGGKTPYVLVEKILAEEERLPETWPVHGTTGYDYLNELNGIFLQTQSEKALQRVYRAFSGQRQGFADLLYDCKVLITKTTMIAELQALANLLQSLLEDNSPGIHLDIQTSRDLLRSVLASYPVYRGYANTSGYRKEDHDAARTAIAAAMRRNHREHHSLLRQIGNLLIPEAHLSRDRAPINFAARFAQFSSALQAKGMEDTAFYRYPLLLSQNEVGGDPGKIGIRLESYHEKCHYRQRHWPYAMLATSTHDTKRGEDSRALLNVLSEIPQAWGRQLRQWSRLNERHRTQCKGLRYPDRLDEAMFYQSLLGAWPSGRRSPTGDFVRRLTEAMLKAVREAKRHTRWTAQNRPYEQAIQRYVTRVLMGAHQARFMKSFLQFHRRIARVGMVNGLAQVVLKTASPGVPDLYQGSELWNRSLVDPDNRRPVDFQRRKQDLRILMPFLEEWPAQPSPGRQAAVNRMLRRWEDGRIKLFVSAGALRLRRMFGRLFVDGTYLPILAKGFAGSRVIAFARTFRDQSVIVVVPRWWLGLGKEAPLPLGDGFWKKSTIPMPSALKGRRYRNIFTGEVVETVLVRGKRVLKLSRALHSFPVAILLDENGLGGISL